MTLPKYFDSSFKSMFKGRFKSSLAFPVLGSFILFVSAVVVPFSTVISMNEMSSGAYYDYLPSIDNVKYLIFSDFHELGRDFPDSTVILYFVTVIASILTAITVFSHLSSKKTANVYYSLGLSRTKLFASTYASGAVSVVGMIVIPFFLSFIVNAFSFGISKELMIALIYTVATLSNVALTAYTLGSIAMVLSGMFFEGAFFAFFLNSVSAILTFAGYLFGGSLLTGSLNEIAERDYYSFSVEFLYSFLGKYSFFNSLSHDACTVEDLSYCLYTSDVENFQGYLSAENWSSPNATSLIIWTLVLCGLIFVANYAFNCKKVENIGFFASSKVLYRIFCGTLIVGFASLGCSNGINHTKGITWLYILIVLAVCLVFNLLFTFIISRHSKINFKQEIKFSYVYSLAVILFAFVFSSGFFGYANRIPSVEKVSEVKVTSMSFYGDTGNYASDDLMLLYDSVSISDDSESFINCITLDGYNALDQYTFKTSADITNVEEFHKALIKADSAKKSNKYAETKVFAKIKIEYTLKNGKTMNRIYNRITPQIIEQFINFNGVSDNIKSNLTDKVKMSVEAAISDKDYPNDAEYLGKYVTAFSSDLTSAHNLNLSDKQLNALADAYSKDIEKLSAKKLLTPSSKCLGVIAIRNNNRITDFDENDEEILLGYTKDLDYSYLPTVYSNKVYSNFDDQCIIVINEDMESTVKWAKQAGVYKFFAKDTKAAVSEVEAVYANSSFFKNRMSKNNLTNLLFAGITNFCDIKISDYRFLSGSHDVYDLTDDEIEYLRENAHPQYLVSETGYFVNFSLSKGGDKYRTSVLFVPDKVLTAELKIKLSESGNE